MRHTLPRLQESYALLGCGSGLDGISKARLEREISTHSKYPLQTHVSGLTRSFLCLRSNMLVHNQTLQSAEQLAAEASELLAANRGSFVAFGSTKPGFTDPLDRGRRAVQGGRRRRF